jgi:hypothetical protein
MKTSFIKAIFFDYKNLARIFWKLPYETRRYLAKVVFFNIVNRLKQIRSAPSAPTLRGFDEYKCIFIHIPKTAGLSIVNSLFGEMKQPSHFPLIRYQLLFTETEYLNYYKFAFVRNPWDRAVSAYTFLMEGGISNFDKEFAFNILSKYKSFDDFVRNWCTESNIFQMAHFIPQYAYVTEPDGSFKLDFLGRFENLQDDFDHICKQLKISRMLERKNITTGRKKDFRVYYTPQSAEIIGRLYAKDIELFGYKFE